MVLFISCLKIIQHGVHFQSIYGNWAAESPGDVLKFYPQGYNYIHNCNYFSSDLNPCF